MHILSMKLLQNLSYVCCPISVLIFASFHIRTRVIKSSTVSNPSFRVFTGVNYSASQLVFQNCTCYTNYSWNTAQDPQPFSFFTQVSFQLRGQFRVFFVSSISLYRAILCSSRPMPEHFT